MSESNGADERSRADEPKNSRWTGLWLTLLVVAVIGHTASLYIPALIGQSPADGDPTQAPARILGAFLWPALLGMIIQRVRSKPRWPGVVLGLIIGFLVYFGSFYVAAMNTGSHPADADAAMTTTSAWTQAELTEDFMRGLTKDQCVQKTISLLRTCDTENCIRNMAGVLGDCVTFAGGDVGAFCETYQQTYVSPNCPDGELSPMSCRVLEVGGTVLCEEQ